MTPPSKADRRGGDLPSFLKIQIDGAARGNPGPAGVGAVLTDSSGRVRSEISLFLGEATNNVAEYCGLIVSLEEALRLGCMRVHVETDSELLARQVTGLYRVRDRQLQWLHALAGRLVSMFSDFEILHIPRLRNRAADRLANRAVSDGLQAGFRSRRRAKSQPMDEAVQPTLF